MATCLFKVLTGAAYLRHMSSCICLFLLMMRLQVVLVNERVIMRPSPFFLRCTPLFAERVF